MSSRWRFGVVLLCLCELSATRGSAYELSGHDWNYQARPINENLTICGTGLPGNGLLRTTDAAASWTAANFTFTFGPNACASGGAYPLFNNVNQIDFGAGLGAGVLAETTSWFLISNPANTLECDMRFSNSFSWFTGTGSPSSTQFDWQSVALHELGHCLGLGHEDRISPPSVMSSTIAPGVARRILTADDYAGRNAIYGIPGGASQSFDLVVPLATAGLAHYYRPNNPIDGWAGAAAVFGHGPYDAATLIQSNLGGAQNFEVIARQRQELVSFYRDHSTSIWHGPVTLLASGVVGNPALIQSSFGNFELVVPLGAGGLAHYYRPNSPIGAWVGPTAIFGGGVYDAVAFIESNLGGARNLEVIARQGQRLVTFYRDHATSIWHGPVTLLASGVVGNPALIQSSFGNFELVVPLGAGGIAHYYRPNSPIGAWVGPTAIFGQGVFDAVTLIESNLGGARNLELIARQGQELVAFYRDHATSMWHGSTSLLAAASAGNPVLIQSR